MLCGGTERRLLIVTNATEHMGGSDEQGRVDRLMTRNRQIAQIGEFIVNPLTFIHIRLSIITMTELKRIMYSEKHAEYIKQTRKTNNK